MIRPKENHERHINICADNACSKCDSTEPYVPGDCPFKILHLLDTSFQLNDGKLINRPRRSGKTTEILRQARLRSKMGESVVIMVGHSSEKERIRRLLKDQAPGEDIKVISAQDSNGLRNLSSSRNTSLVADEIDSVAFQRIMETLRPGIFKGGLTTPHG